MKLRLCHWMLFSVMLMALSACDEHKELCFDHTHSVDINVSFNWDGAPDANPQTMVVHFFSLDGKHVTRREFSSREGGTVRMETGEYRILFHNGEMDNVNENVDTYDKYELFTPEESLLAPMSREMSAPPRPAPAENEPVRASPDKVWAGSHEYLMIAREGGQSVQLFPEEVTIHYTVQLTNVVNLRDNIYISGALTGLSERFCISGGKATGVPVTIPFSVERKDATTLQAQFLSFGHCPDDNKVPHILSIYTSDMTYYNFDVTDQLHDAVDSNDISIVISGLTLPEEGGQEVSPGIDLWDEVEEVEIKM